MVYSYFPRLFPKTVARSSRLNKQKVAPLIISWDVKISHNLEKLERMSDENLCFFTQVLSWAGNWFRSHATFISTLLCSHSTFFVSITRLTNQSFLLYKTLGINIGGTIVLHLFFTGTLALKLLNRVCTKTRKFYILLSSDPPHCGLMLSSKKEWISTGVAAAPVPSLLSFPQQRSLLTSSVSSKRLSRICFLRTVVLERTLLNWSLTWRVWIQRLRFFFLLTLYP